MIWFVVGQWIQIYHGEKQTKTVIYDAFAYRICGVIVFYMSWCCCAQWD